MARYDWLVPVACLLAYAAIEGTWLWSMSPAFYVPGLARIQPVIKPNLGATALCYAILVPVMYLFLVHPIATAPVPFWPSMGLAAALGLVVFGTHNLTNKAVFAKYPWSITLVDTAYGVVAFVAVALVAQCVARRHMWRGHVDLVGQKQEEAHRRSQSQHVQQ